MYDNSVKNENIYKVFCQICSLPLKNISCVIYSKFGCVSFIKKLSMIKMVWAYLLPYKKKKQSKQKIQWILFGLKSRVPPTLFLCQTINLPYLLNLHWKFKILTNIKVTNIFLLKHRMVHSLPVSMTSAFIWLSCKCIQVLN